MQKRTINSGQRWTADLIKYLRDVWLFEWIKGCTYGLMD